MRTRSIVVAGLCSFALAAAMPVAISAHGSASIGVGGIGASASIGPGISGALSAPASLGLSGNTPAGSGNVTGSGDFGTNASLNRGGATSSSAMTAALQGTSTVTGIGSGTITLATSSGRALTLNMSPSEIRTLGLRVGSKIAMTRKAGQVFVTNLDTMISMTGRAVVKRVVGDAVMFTNKTGTHTVSLAKGAVQRMHLHPGSVVMVSMTQSDQLEVTATR